MIELEAPAGDELLSAACTLGPGAMKERIGEWVALRNRCIDVRRTPDGAVLILSVDEPLDAVAGLVARESECCGFYRFSLRVAGGTRELRSKPVLVAPRR